MIVLVGPSASGKTDLGKYLCKEYCLIKAITHTTRAPRKGEKDGVDYYFVTEEEFSSLLSHDSFVETTFYNGHHYGSSKKEIDDDKVIVVDPVGMDAYLKLHDDHIVVFFLTATQKTRIERMKKRGDSPSNIRSRIESDKTAFATDKVVGYDYVIKTDKRTMESIGEEVYSKYLDKLKERNIKPNVLIQ